VRRRGARGRRGPLGRYFDILEGRPNVWEVFRNSTLSKILSEMRSGLCEHFVWVEI
jgi:hypothetical protein